MAYRKIDHKIKWHSKRMPAPPVRRRGKASLLDNIEELIQKGLIGILDDTYKSYAHAGLELAKEFEIKQQSENAWQHISPPDTTADTLAHRISKAHKAYKNTQVS